MDIKIFSIEIVKFNNITEQEIVQRSTDHSVGSCCLEQLKDYGYQPLSPKVYYKFNVSEDNRLVDIIDKHKIQGSIYIKNGQVKWSYRGWAYNELTQISLTFEAGLYFLVYDFKLTQLPDEIKYSIMDIIYQTEVKLASNPENIRLVI